MESYHRKCDHIPVEKGQDRLGADEGLASAFAFLHAADIHLDSPLKGLSAYEGVPAAAVRTATRDALNNLVDLALEQRVAFVIIAGDLYDGDWEDFGTGLFFCGAMGRLGRAGIEVFLLYGNHDAASQITKRLPLPPNVKVFDHRKPQTLQNDATNTKLHGQSYSARDPGCSLAAKYPPAVAGEFNIGVLHTALTGDPEHAPYSPCTPAELSAKGYDYWALGHVHGFSIIQKDPYIVFPGNLQGRHIRETGAKGAVLVSVQDGTITDLEHVALDTVRWSRVDLDLRSVENTAELERVVRDGLVDAFAREANGRSLIVRVRLFGATAAHSSLRVRGSDLREDIRAIATAVSESLWIERVVVDTTSLADFAGHPDTADELTSLLSRACEDESFLQALRSEFNDLIGRLPPDLGHDSELLKNVRNGEFETIVNDAVSVVRARLEDRTI